MTSTIDMSLDEIIKLNNIRPNRPNNGRRFGNNQFNRNGPKRLTDGRNGGARRPNYQQTNNRTQENFRSNSRDFQQRTPFVGNRDGKCKMFISNLASSVNSDDIEELFATFGNISAASVHYDQRGNCLGTGEVTFERRSEALEAVRKLNNVPLDGMSACYLYSTFQTFHFPGNPLKLNVLSDDNADTFTSAVRQTHRPAPRHNDNYNRNNNRTNRFNRFNDRNGGGNRPNQRASKKPLSAEDLDREMDEYRQKATFSNGHADESLMDD